MLQDQLIAVLVGALLEPLVRFLKNKFALSGTAMLLVTAGVAGLGALIVVGFQISQEGGPITFERIVTVLPTVFAIGQVIYALL